MSTLEVNSIDKESGSTLTLGGSGTQVTLHASATSSGFDSGLASVQTFTSSGTWTRPSGITKVIMEVQGAGGGGSKGANADYNQPGAGGGYAKKLLDVSSISTSTITVGTGGAGVAHGTTGNGGDGGASSWADGTNTITGNGGAGGDASAVHIASDGGTGVGGDVNISGQTVRNTDKVAGDSILGYGGMLAHSSDLPSAAKNGQGYGGGGSEWSGYSVDCGSGANGIVIVWEYK